MRASLATQIRLHRRFFSLLRPPALEPSLPDLIFLFSTNYFSTPRGYLKIKKLLHTLRPKLASRMVREVGFEPTNPYGTGASGLRVQDPHSRRVSLTWLGNTSRPHNKADSRKHQARSRKDPNPNDAPNWLSPINQSHQNRAMFN